MNKLFLLSALAVLTSLCSCQKQQTDAERDAEVERRVQDRLAADKQAQQQQQLDQRQADLDAREKSLADKEKPGVQPPAEAEQSESESREPVSRPRAPRDGSITTGYTTFYNKLEPYGDWIETNDYGYVFHPRQAESSGRWRPYTDGRWVYTDAGWTWISEEAFGWATYHYGRWTRLRGIGWVWVPGNQWAPAWVSWRKSNDYVGWAPLPPEARFDQHTGIRNWSDSYYDVGPDQYCFVASREFGAPRVEQTLLPPERNVAIINQTTNVTNITYNNTTIVNEGPSYDELKSISREPVQRYRLERNANVNVSAQLPGPQVHGETVVIAAPVIAAPVANERPTTVKQTVASAAVDLGWAAISNQDEAKRTRQKMKSEASPPPNVPPKKFVRGSGPAIPQVAGGAAASVPSATIAPAQTTPSVAASTPSPALTPRALGTTSPVSSASASAPVSQGRERTRIPPGVPAPRASASANATSTPVKQPTTVEQPAASPIPQKSPRRGEFQPGGQGSNLRRVEPMPSASASTSPSADAPGKGGWKGRGFKVPNESQPSQPSAQPTASPPAALMPSAPAANSSATESPAEKLTKQEKKEQKAQMRAERKELKRERKPGLEDASPSATP